MFSSSAGHPWEMSKSEMAASALRLHLCFSGEERECSTMNRAKLAGSSWSGPRKNTVFLQKACVGADTQVQNRNTVGKIVGTLQSKGQQKEMTQGGWHTLKEPTDTRPTSANTTRSGPGRRDTSDGMSTPCNLTAAVSVPSSGPQPPLPVLQLHVIAPGDMALDGPTRILDLHSLRAHTAVTSGPVPPEPNSGPSLSPGPKGTRPVNPQRGPVPSQAPRPTKSKRWPNAGPCICEICICGRHHCPRCNPAAANACPFAGASTSHEAFPAHGPQPRAARAARGDALPRATGPFDGTSEMREAFPGHDAAAGQVCGRRSGHGGGPVLQGSRRVCEEGATSPLPSPCPSSEAAPGRGARARRCLPPASASGSADGRPLLRGTFRGWVARQKKVCVPETGLQNRASVVPASFSLKKNFPMWVGGSAEAGHAVRARCTLGACIPPVQQ